MSARNRQALEGGELLGAMFTWADDEGKPTNGTTVWSVGAVGSSQYAPSTAPFMINYQVDDMDALLQSPPGEGAADHPYASLAYARSLPQIGEPLQLGVAT